MFLLLMNVNKILKCLRFKYIQPWPKELDPSRLFRLCAKINETRLNKRIWHICQYTLS